MRWIMDGCLNHWIVPVHAEQLLCEHESNNTVIFLKSFLKNIFRLTDSFPVVEY